MSEINQQQLDRYYNIGRQFSRTVHPTQRLSDNYEVPLTREQAIQAGRYFLSYGMKPNWYRGKIVRNSKRQSYSSPEDMYESLQNKIKYYQKNIDYLKNNYNDSSNGKFRRTAIQDWQRKLSAINKLLGFYNGSSQPFTQQTQQTSLPNYMSSNNSVTYNPVKSMAIKEPTIKKQIKMKRFLPTTNSDFGGGVSSLNNSYTKSGNIDKVVKDKSNIDKVINLFDRLVDKGYNKGEGFGIA